MAGVSGGSIEHWLRAGIDAARAGQRREARDLLARVVQEDEANLSAWLWLSGVVDDGHEQQYCVERVRALMLRTDYRAAAVDRASQSAQSGVRPLGAGPAIGRRLPAEPAMPLGARLAGRIRSWASSTTVIALAYLVAIALAELLTTFVDPQLGLAVDCLLLVGLLFHSSRAVGKEQRALLVCLAFAPLIRILSLTLPLYRFPMLYWYLIISIPLFAAVGVAAPALGYSWRALGLHLRGWPLQILLGLSGLAFGAVEFFILRPDPLASSMAWTDALWPALVLLVSTGLLEEVIFRGLLQRAAIDALGGWGLLYVALLFASLHIGYRSLVDLLLVLGVGFFLGWIVQRTGSLLGASLSHGLTNVVLYLVMPFLFGWRAY